MCAHLFVCLFFTAIIVGNSAMYPRPLGEMMIQYEMYVLDGILVLIKTRNHNFTFSVLGQENSEAGFNNIITLVGNI